MSKPHAPRGRRLFRRLRLLAVLAVGVVLAGVVALPALLGTEPARRWLLGQANAVLAPDGGLVVERFRFSWFGATRMTGFAITDGQGRRLVQAPEAIWDRSLRHILFDLPRYGTLILDDAVVEIERDVEGVVDLQAALAPILAPNPRSELTIRIRDGSLRMRSPDLAIPLVTDDLDLTYRRPLAPDRATWRIALGDPSDPGAELTVLGDVDTWNARPGLPEDMTLLVDGAAWPVDVVLGGKALRGTFDGKLRLNRLGGLWSTRGDARLTGVEASSPETSDSPFRLDHVGGVWDASRTAAGWVVRDLDVTSPLGQIQVQADFDGTSEPESSPRLVARIEGDVDLAALAALGPSRISDEGRLAEGRARLQLSTTAENLLVATSNAPRIVPVAYQADSPPAAPLPPGAEVGLEGTIDLDGLLWSGQGGNLEVPPIALAVRAAYQADADAIELEELVVDGPLGTVRAFGRLEQPAGRASAQLQGTLDADWEAIRGQIADLIDPDLDLDGGPIHFRLSGPLEGGTNFVNLWRALAIETRVELSSVRAFGLYAGPTTISARSLQGELSIDPIRADVNGGEVEIFPELEIADDGLATLRLSPLSRALDVEINDVVSRRVLTYVAPIMAQATSARGRVSATISRAEFPLDLGLAAGDLPARSSLVEGLVVFEDVEFVAGPLADDILDLVKARGERVLRLDQPVVLAIADGEVHQTGLAIPIANVTRIEMDGTVGFDQSIDLRTRIALTDEMFGNADVLGAIADGVRITVPITGTLDRPKLDKEAFGAEMAAMGKDLLGRSAVVGGVQLLQKLLTPPDPEAAARRQAERERRREERLRQQEERRRARNGL